MKAHPAAKLFPLMVGAELEQLANDIRANGLLRAVVTLNGQVLDGRNRLAACKLAGVEPRLVEWDGTGSPVGYVLSENVHRRHLTDSQRAMVASDALPLLEREAKARQVASLKRGTKAPVTAPGRTRGTAAGIAARPAGVGARSVERAKAVIAASSELAARVRSGDITLKQAEKQIRTADQVAKVLAYHPPTGEYSLIVRDPAWPYRDQLDGSDGARGGLTYPPRTIENICADVPPAAKDCALWLWVTNAHLTDGSAARVLEAWKFKPMTMATWPKLKMGTGTWLRGRTEHVILAVRGHPVVHLTNQSTLLPPWPPGKAGKHSSKPAEFFPWAAKHCPCLPEARLEMDSRDQREGWTTSGAEA